MADDENPFVISAPEEDPDGLDQATRDALMAQELMREVDEEEGQYVAQEEMGVEGLVPFCVKDASGPMQNTAVYGYDISQMQEKPWAKPGANLSDYFNYGFNEASWRMYCAMQPNGINSVLSKTQEFTQQHQPARQPEPSHMAAPPYEPPPMPTGYGRGMGPRHGRCHQWMQEGRCNRENCRYSHGEGPMPTMPPPPPQQPPGGILDLPPPGLYPPPILPQGPPGQPPFPLMQLPMGGSGFRMPPKQQFDDEGAMEEPLSKKLRMEQR